MSIIENLTFKDGKVCPDSALACLERSFSFFEEYEPNCLALIAHFFVQKEIGRTQKGLSNTRNDEENILNSIKRLFYNAAQSRYSGSSLDGYEFVDLISNLCTAIPRKRAIYATQWEAFWGGIPSPKELEVVLYEFLSGRGVSFPGMVTDNNGLSVLPDEGRKLCFLISMSFFKALSFNDYFMRHDSVYISKLFCDRIEIRHAITPDDYHILCKRFAGMIMKSAKVRRFFRILYYRPGAHRL